MFGYCFYIHSSPLNFSAHGQSFLNNGLDNTEWASFILDLHTKFRMISREVPGFAYGSPCGVWGRGWTTCPLFWYFLSITCLSVFFHYPSVAFCLSSLYFYSEITFLFKVLCTTIFHKRSLDSFLFVFSILELSGYNALGADDGDDGTDTSGNNFVISV